MIRRIWRAYRVELHKVIRSRVTYTGPIALVLVALCLLRIQPVARDGQGDYDFVAYATSVLMNLLGLFFVLVHSSSLISSECATGVIRTVLVRPIRRVDYVLAKYLVGLSYAGLLLLTAVLSAWVLAVLFGDMTGVSYGGEVLYTHSEMVRAYILGMAGAVAPLMATVAYGLFISVLMTKPAAAVGTAIGFQLVLDLVKHPLRITPYVFTTYLETPWRVFMDQAHGFNAEWLPTMYTCLLCSLISFAVFTGLAVVVMHRRNLHR